MIQFDYIIFFNWVETTNQPCYVVIIINYIKQPTSTMEIQEGFLRGPPGILHQPLGG